jgi:hypothetical protein
MKAFPIPPRMAHLPKDSRGYPIPHTVVIRHGRPHFTVNEEHLRQQCIAEDRCPICAGKLFRLRWSVGGPLSAFHDHGAYLDPPMHEECVHYALQVCPYLAAPRYSGLIDDATMPEAEKPFILRDRQVVNQRPELFVAVGHVGQHHVKATLAGMPVVRYIKPKQPYRSVEFWRHGQRITAEAAHPLIVASGATPPV